MIAYTDCHLIIDIKTSSPEATHSMLMGAIAACMRWAAHADFTDEDHNNVAFLAGFLRDIIPNEFQLSCPVEKSVR